MKVRASKAVHICLFSGKLKCTVLWYPNIYDYGQDPHGATCVDAIFTEQLFDGKRPVGIDRAA